MVRLLVFDSFVFISALIFFGYLLGLHKFLSKNGNNGCEMTYMYEYPQFVKVSLPPNVTLEYRRYGLYAYSEGKQTQQVRNMQFSGLPVLFIPGHGGSLKQVRSLASVALRKAMGSDSPFHFDFFTLDLNEEYSAMFGGVLTDQTRFAVHATNRIFSLYRKVRPESIVIIGYSMGGMIAKGMFLEPDFPSHAVKLLVTLATPHTPVILTDPLLRDYYTRVSPDWAAGSNMTIISLGGGVRDLVVRSGLALTDQADISALTTAVSDVWLPVDHLCILWCKQLVLVLVRALFDCVDLTSLQISRDPHLRLNVFKYHLLERSAGKRFHEAEHSAQTTLQTGRTEWLELSRPQHSVLRTSLHLPLHLLVHLTTPADTLAVSTLGHKAHDWLFACPQITEINGGRRVCTRAENLSSLGRIAPTKHKKHKVALVNLQDLRARGLHYIVIRLPPSNEHTWVGYDMFTAKERTMTVSLPRWSLPLQWTTVLSSTSPESLFYTLELPQLERPWQAYQLSLQVMSCTNTTHQAVATLRVPWSNQHSSVVLRNQDEVTLPIILHTAKPTDLAVPAPYISLHLDPKCQYSVHVQSSLVESLAQIVRLYSSQLVAYVAAILLLTLRQQLISLSTQQHCLLFHHALLEGAKPYYILPAVKIISTILNWRSVPESVRVLLPTPDLSYIVSAGLDFILLPLCLYAVAFALTFLLGLLAYGGVVFSGSTVNKFALKFLGKLAGVSRTWTDWLMAAIDKVPCIVSAGMVAILFSACGGLAMLVGTIYYFMRVCGMYEDYIEQLFFAPVKYFKNTVIAKWRGQPVPVVNQVLKEAEDLLSLKGLTEFNFHMTLVLLWGTATVVHLPSVLVWAHNFNHTMTEWRDQSSLTVWQWKKQTMVMMTANRYNPMLDPDPAMTTGLVSSVCAAVIWSLNTPLCSDDGKKYEAMANIMFVLACLVLIYCPISLYNLPVLTSISLVCLSLHQLFEWISERWLQSADSTSLLSTDADQAIAEAADDTDQSDVSESASRKQSRTSEISMSSYEAVSLNDLMSDRKTVEVEELEEKDSSESKEEEDESEECEAEEEEEVEEEEVDDKSENDGQGDEENESDDDEREQQQQAKKFNKKATKKEFSSFTSQKLKRKQSNIENDEDEV